MQPMFSIVVLLVPRSNATSSERMESFSEDYRIYSQVIMLYPNKLIMVMNSNSMKSVDR